MIPTTWVRHERAEDGELVGYLVPAGDRIVPTTLVGTALGPPVERAVAERRLEADGLVVLAGRWLLDRPGAEPVAVAIVETAPDRVTLESVDYGSEGGFGARYVLDAPADGALRRA